MSFTVKPPMLTGNDRQDIMNLRDYLFQMAKSLDPITEGANTVAQSVSYQHGKKVVKPVPSDDPEIQKLKQTFGTLQSLIVKTGNALGQEVKNREDGDSTAESNANNYTDGMKQLYDNTYLSQSDFGTYNEYVLPGLIKDKIDGLMEGDEYGIAQEISDLSDLLGYVDKIAKETSGQIMRGIYWDPYENGGLGGYVIGIAISQKISLKAQLTPAAEAYLQSLQDEQHYVEIESNQTFGLYTSTGWQFFIEGERVGWFDSRDANAALNIRSASVAEKVTVGGTWEQKTELISGSRMFTISYIGS